MFIVERIISKVAPHNCLVCDREGDLLCLWCRPDSLLPVPSRCYRCKSSTVDFKTCQKCRGKSRLRHVWVATDYGGTAKQLSHVYKFERAQAASRIIAKAMSGVLPLMPTGTIIIPIPSATSRQRSRGYDHALLLAKQLASQKRLNYVAVLGRLGQSRQVGSTRQTRLSQLDGSFYVNRPKAVKGQSILLVDDIVTTGGTLEAAAKALRQAGAKSVSAVVFAQKT